ncbi:chromate transporter [Paenibacillus sp. FSL K6-2862]|uniref:chromate transporter n=1 Tax=Paenibacillus sp. FSL K6-2862 TaxID=2921484 RepID=UPI0030FB38E4
MNVKQKKYTYMLLELFVVFFKLGPSTFGGGYALITAIEREVVDKKAWMKQNEVENMVSVAGSIPGGVAVNSAAYVGYRLAGIIGAVIAVIAITLPTFAIVFILNSLGIMFQDVPKVEAALKGVHAAVVALIIVAALKVGRTSIMDASTMVMAGLCVFLLLFTSIQSLYLIIGGPIIGMTIISIKRVLGYSDKTEKEERNNQPDLNYPEYYI